MHEMFGLVNRHTSTNLKLKASSIFAEVNGFAARVLATLRYYNDLDCDIDGLYIFPQDWKTTVVELEVTVEERHVHSEIRDYISSEHEKRAFPIEEREDGLFCLGIGRIPPHVSVFVQVTLITELNTDEETGGTVFILPSVFTPRLSSPENEQTESSSLNESQLLSPYVPRQTQERYSFDFQLEVSSTCLLAGCSSPTHAIQVDADSRATSASRIHITMAEPHPYDRELKILLHLSHPYDPYVLIEEGRKKERADTKRSDFIDQLHQKAAIMISYHPQIESSNSVAEFIFLVDRSGSMSGNHIFNLKESLVLCLKSLPTSCFFNVIGFGSYYRSVFHDSEPYSDESVERALQYIKKMRADLGGTDLILPLKFIFDQPRKPKVPRIVFLLTDGGISNTLQVVDLVRRNAHTTSFYTFGIGPEACPNLVQGVAAAGRGKAYFINEEERMPVKVIEALKETMQPAITDIQVSWHVPKGYDVVQTPEQVPLVFNGKRMAIYGILSRPRGEENKESPRNTKRWRMDWSSRSFSSNSVKVFWFDDDLEYLPEEQRLQELNEMEPSDDELFVDGGPTPQGRASFDTEVRSACVEDEGEFKDDATTPVPIEDSVNDPKGKLLNISKENLFERFVSDNFNDKDNEEEASSKMTNPGGLEGKEVTSPGRDSCIGYSMEECDKSPEGKSKSTFAEIAVDFAKNTEGLQQQLSISDSATETMRPHTEGDQADPQHADLPGNVFPGSKLLEQLGLPQNFAAVSIKGFVGQKELEQIIPFPAEKTRTSSKQTTIHQLAARSIIRDLEASLNNEYNVPKTVQRICSLSKQAAIQCRRTSIASVDQYCFEDEVISAFQHPRKETDAEGRRRLFVLERIQGFTAGLGRRLPSPEGSDNEALPKDEEHAEEMESAEHEKAPESEEETQDFYRLERSASAESEELLKEVGYPFQVCVVRNGKSEVPPLSTRFVVGEKQEPPVITCLPQATRAVSPALKLVPEKNLGFINLASLQSPFGYWDLTESFAEILEIPLGKLQEASPLADSSVYVSEELRPLMDSDHCDYNLQLWATALALAWLCRKWGRLHQGEWCLVASKATKWMDERSLPRGFTTGDLKTVAYQALVLVDKERRNSSEILSDTRHLQGIGVARKLFKSRSFHGFDSGHRKSIDI